MNPQGTHRTRLGRQGEALALSYLKSRGYKFIDRNFHSRFGEIDLILQDNKTLVFVEVKTRWSRSFGKPTEAVTRFKLNSIKRTSEYFLLLKPDLPKTQRIDLVAIEVNSQGKLLQLEHRKNLTL